MTDRRHADKTADEVKEEVLAVAQRVHAAGLVVGTAGVLTVVPGLAEPSAVLFGLGFIAWFAWAGLVLRRR